MSKETAHETLTRWKLGIENYPRHIINYALYVTGDLDQ